MSKNYKLVDKVYIGSKQESCKEIIENLLPEAEQYVIDTYFKKNDSDILTKEVLEQEKLFAICDYITIKGEFDFKDENQLLVYKNKMMKSLVFNYVLPAIKDDIIETSDLSFIWALGKALSINSNSRPIYPRIQVNGRLRALFECKTGIFSSVPYTFECVFLDNGYATIYKYFLAYIKGDKRVSQKKLDNDFRRGLEFILDSFGQEYLDQFVSSFFKNYQDTKYMTIFEDDAPYFFGEEYFDSGIMHTMFKLMLNQCLPYVKDENLKSEIKLELMLD